MDTPTKGLLFVAGGVLVLAVAGVAVATRGRFPNLGRGRDGYVRGTHLQIVFGSAWVILGLTVALRAPLLLVAVAMVVAFAVIVFGLFGPLARKLIAWLESRGTPSI